MKNEPADDEVGECECVAMRMKKKGMIEIGAEKRNIKRENELL